MLILTQDVSRLLVEFDARIEELHAESETIASSSLHGQTGLFPVTSVTGLCTYKQPSVSLTLSDEGMLLTMYRCKQSKQCLPCIPCKSDDLEIHNISIL